VFRAGAQVSAEATSYSRAPRSLRHIAGTSEGPKCFPGTARIDTLGLGYFVKVDCAACHHVALLTPEALLRLGLSPAARFSTSRSLNIELQNALNPPREGVFGEMQTIRHTFFIHQIRVRGDEPGPGRAQGPITPARSHCWLASVMDQLAALRVAWLVAWLLGAVLSRKWRYQLLRVGQHFQPPNRRQCRVDGGRG
jgi:hypothetical protein